MCVCFTPFCPVVLSFLSFLKVFFKPLVFLCKWRCVNHVCLVWSKPCCAPPVCAEKLVVNKNTQQVQEKCLYVLKWILKWWIYCFKPINYVTWCWIEAPESKLFTSCCHVITCLPVHVVLFNSVNKTSSAHRKFNHFLSHKGQHCLSIWILTVKSKLKVVIWKH